MLCPNFCFAVFGSSVGATLRDRTRDRRVNRHDKCKPHLAGVGSNQFCSPLPLRQFGKVKRTILYFFATLRRFQNVAAVRMTKVILDRDCLPDHDTSASAPAQLCLSWGFTVGRYSLTLVPMIADSRSHNHSHTTGQGLLSYTPCCHPIGFAVEDYRRLSERNAMHLHRVALGVKP